MTDEPKQYKTEEAFRTALETRLQAEFEGVVFMGKVSISQKMRVAEVRKGFSLI